MSASVCEEGQAATWNRKQEPGHFLKKWDISKSVLQNATFSVKLTSEDFFQTSLLEGWVR